MSGLIPISDDQAQRLRNQGIQVTTCFAIPRELYDAFSDINPAAVDGEAKPITKRRKQRIGNHFEVVPEAVAKLDPTTTSKPAEWARCVFNPEHNIGKITRQEVYERLSGYGSEARPSWLLFEFYRMGILKIDRETGADA